MNKHFFEKIRSLYCLRLLLLIVVSIVILFRNNGISSEFPSEHVNIPVDIKKMRQTVHELTAIDPPRNAQHVSSLDKSAEFILEEFNKTGCRTEIQSFTVSGKEYKNVICSFGPKEGERIIIGAHYDVYGEQSGADDNASGVAGLLELARLFHSMKPALKYRTDFVAFTLEEPQYFRTRHMGSYVYAKSLKDTGVQVRAMIALEMIGYFTDKPQSQKYPIFFLKALYPNTGNFIAVVGKWKQNSFVEKVKGSMKSGSKLPVESIAAPAFVPGIDFSDHQSFWRFGYNAVMITDTSFYRNHNYHEPTDTIDILDFDKMAEVVKGLYWTVTNL